MSHSAALPGQIAELQPNRHAFAMKVTQDFAGTVEVADSLVSPVLVNELLDLVVCQTFRGMQDVPDSASDDANGDEDEGRHGSHPYLQPKNFPFDVRAKFLAPNATRGQALDRWAVLGRDVAPFGLPLRYSAPGHPQSTGECRLTAQKVGSDVDRVCRHAPIIASFSINASPPSSQVLILLS